MSGSVGGIVLAAGLSRRMRDRDKLLVEIEGTPMVRRVVQTALEAGLDPVVVVVGHSASEVRRALKGLPASLAENERPEAGLSASLRVGIHSLADARGGEVSAAVVLLADMPWVQATDVRALVAAFDPAERREACVPTFEGRRGNPVLWGARFFAEMQQLQGDVGARSLLDRHADHVHEVPVEGVGILRDVDTPEALAPQSTGR